MKKLSILFVVILILSLLSACNFSEQPGKADWEESRKEKFITTYMDRSVGNAVLDPSQWCEYGGRWCWLAYADGYDYLVYDKRDDPDKTPLSYTIKGYTFESDRYFCLYQYKDGDIAQLDRNTDKHYPNLDISNETIEVVLQAFNTHMKSHKASKEAPVVNVPATTDISTPAWDESSKALYEALVAEVYGSEDIEPHNWCDGSNHRGICYLTSGDGYHIVSQGPMDKLSTEAIEVLKIGEYEFTYGTHFGIYAFKEGRLVHLSYLYRLGEVSETTVKAAWEAFLEHGGLEGI